MPRYPLLSTTAHGLTAQVYTSLLGVAQRSAPEVFALNVGDTYRAPPLAAFAREEAHAPIGYTDVRGMPSLRDAIVVQAAREGVVLDRERLQVTLGATSGLDIAARALFASGDEVLVLAPFWPLIRGIISAAGATPIEVPFYDRLGTAEFDAARVLEGAITPRTAGIYVNSPNNPTGAVLDAHTIDAIARIAAKHDLWVIADTAYARLSHVPITPLHSHPDIAERVVVAHTYSKTYGLAGARIGYLYGAESALRSIFDLQCYATYCAARPMQELLTRVLQDPASEAWLAETRALYLRAARLTADALGVAAPDSGTFVLFDTRPFLRAGEAPSALLTRLAENGVVLTPGSAAGSAYGHCARLCFTALPLDSLERALATMRRVLYA